MTETLQINRERLVSDYRSVNLALATVLQEPEKNYYVFKETYIHPTLLMPKIVPLADEFGSFAYFSKLRATLEAALTKGSVPKELQFPDISKPRYLSDLFEK